VADFARGGGEAGVRWAQESILLRSQASFGGERGARGKMRMPAFHSVETRNGHWWFVSPEGEPVFSVGMNHVDSATLRCAEGLEVWNETYGNDLERWLRERVRVDLESWGFNAVGWVQEVVVRGPTESTLHRHSRDFIYEEYQWLGMPYCHMLPFAEIHQWDVETRYPDVFSSEFEAWCDYVGRSMCARMADDPKLIGYFLSDCPTWAHRSLPHPSKAPWFDPGRLDCAGGRRELLELATRYYQVTHDAIRRYDPNHLILGDRYEAKALVPDEVLEAATPYVDVLSFQHFSDCNTISADFERWHAQTGLPVLLADACVPRPKAQGAEGRYGEMLRTLRETPCCVGWHYCGAYLENNARKRGLRDREDCVDEALVQAMARANAETHAWVRQVSQHHDGR